MKRSWNRRSVRVCLVTLLVATVCYVGYSVSAEPPQGKDKATASQKKPGKSKDKKDDAKEPPLRKFMRGKMSASNDILEGILTEDFKLIEDGGKRLKDISAAEKWRISNDMMYRHHSEDFRNNVDKLIKAAKEGKSVDRVALIWFDTTLSCIDCHQWVRTVLIADARPN